jgi:hypothetical protein
MAGIAVGASLVLVAAWPWCDPLSRAHQVTVNSVNIPAA